MSKGQTGQCYEKMRKTFEQMRTQTSLCPKANPKNSFTFRGVFNVSSRRNLRPGNKIAHATLAIPPKAIACKHFSFFSLLAPIPQPALVLQLAPNSKINASMVARRIPSCKPVVTFHQIVKEHQIVIIRTDQ
jgi:hypothetical protein